MLDVERLSFSYKKNGKKILDSVSFRVDEGQIVAVLGANGAGKSTLFRCVLGLLRNYDGKASIDNKDIQAMSRKELARKVAYIPQTETPVFNYNVLDYVLMGTSGMLSPLQSPMEEHLRITRKAIEMLGMGYMENCGINEISGGERQLAFLARAMAQNAKILIMDEPTANLDYGNQQKVLKQVRGMTSDGYTVLLSTHNPEHALQFATHILALKNNKVLAFGKVEDVLTEGMIKEIYNLNVTIMDVNVQGKQLKSCIPL